MIHNHQISKKIQERLLGLLLLGLAIGVYWQVVHYDILSLDDPAYLYENPHVRYGLTASGMVWAFTTFFAANWHPLTWLSHMLDVQIYGFNPAGFHLTNVIFHSVNTLLLFLLLKDTTNALWRSFLVAALFALHPLHIESVAWISERKDVLCAFFWLLTMLSYVKYSRSFSNFWYVTALFCFILGLMSKPMIVTLPFVLILFDFWPLGRIGSGEHRYPDLSVQDNATTPLFPPAGLQRIVIEKIPFFLLTVASGIVTYIAQASEWSVTSLVSLPLKSRILNAAYSYILYIYKMFWPIDLAIFYPHPQKSLDIWICSAAIAAIMVVCLLTILYHKRKPYAAVGWFWFLGTLVPVIGIVQVGAQGMADRYTYIPLIGLFIMIVWSLSDFLVKLKISRWLQYALSVTIIIALISITGWQLTYWKNNLSLFNRALAVTSENYLAHGALATFHKLTGNMDSYKHHYQQAIEMNADFVAMKHNRYGYSLLQNGRIGEGIEEFKAALRIRPEYLSAAHNIGVALAMDGRLDEAILQFRDVLKKNPQFPKTQESLFNALRERESRPAVSGTR